jgi:WD40 repeat protein
MDFETRARSAGQGVNRAVEVMEMTTQTEQPRKVERFDKYQERKNRNRRIGALAVAGAVALILAVVAVGTTRRDTTTPGDNSPIGNPAVSWPISALGTGGFTVDLTTGATAPLPASIRDMGSAFVVSPDHTQFVYNSRQGFGLFIANVDGTGERQISSDNTIGPQWSPDGSMIVYQQRSSASTELGNLFVYNVQTGQSTQVTHLDQSTRTGGWWYMDPSFIGTDVFGSAGPSVLFQMPRGTNPQAWDLWAVPVSGGKPQLVEKNAGWGAVYGLNDQFAYASPVSAATFNGGALYLEPHPYNSPSGLGKRIASGPIIKVVWSPDGTRVAYTSGDYVHVLNVQSGSDTTVVKGDNAEWLDDNTLVIGN